MVAVPPALHYLSKIIQAYKKFGKIQEIDLERQKNEEKLPQMNKLHITDKLKNIIKERPMVYLTMFTVMDGAAKTSFEF